MSLSIRDFARSNIKSERIHADESDNEDISYLPAPTQGKFISELFQIQNYFSVNAIHLIDFHYKFLNFRSQISWPIFTSWLCKCPKKWKRWEALLWSKGRRWQYQSPVSKHNWWLCQQWRWAGWNGKDGISNWLYQRLWSFCLHKAEEGWQEDILLWYLPDRAQFSWHNEVTCTRSKFNTKKLLLYFLIIGNFR